MDFIDLKTQRLRIANEVDSRIAGVLAHGAFIMGPEVAEMEGRLAAYTGADYCISVASGTEALFISLLALGVGSGDEVITTPFTFVATVETIVLAGATPVLVDIEPETYNIDWRQLEDAITPRTRAIMPVSLYGQPADMDEINEIAARHGIPVVEDGAQSFGASYKGRKSGSLSTVGCTSFFPSKPLGCYGDGGAIFTSDSELAKICRQIRVHGQEQRYIHGRIGVGGRMDTIQCAVVLAKLEIFDDEFRTRTEVAARYNAMLANAEVQLPVIRGDRNSAYAQYTVRVADRDRIQADLKEECIPTAVHYPRPLHHQPAYVDCCRYECLPNAEEAAAEVISLPMHPYLDSDQQTTIVEALCLAINQEG
ncbi:DegT/DnrJ/EryC1/StrS family aminotransferase [Pseudomonadota bacterium]